MVRYIVEVEGSTVKIGDGEAQQIEHYHEGTDERVMVLLTVADFMGVDLSEVDLDACLQ